jgi:hypothetical protein
MKTFELNLNQMIRSDGLKMLALGSGVVLHHFQTPFQFLAFGPILVVNFLPLFTSFLLIEAMCIKAVTVLGRIWCSISHS